MADKGAPVATQKTEGSGVQTSGESSAADKKPTVEEELAVLELQPSCFDGLRRMLYSKTEWEAYLLERIEKKKDREDSKRSGNT